MKKKNLKGGCENIIGPNMKIEENREKKRLSALDQRSIGHTCCPRMEGLPR
jgi:hypothetical protein